MNIKEIIYVASAAVCSEPYTHRMVGHVLGTAAKRDYSIRLLVPDRPEALESSLLMRLIRNGQGIIPRVVVGTYLSNLPLAAPGSLLLFAGSLDFWRFATRSFHTIRKYKKIFWLQGIESDESFLKHNSILRRLAISVVESTAMMASKVVICPSDTMIDTVLNRYPFLKQKTFITIPNLADARPVPPREPTLWGFKKLPSLVLGYCGGLSPWQCFAETCRIVAEVQNQLPDSWFFVLTRSKTEAEGLLQHHKVKRYRIRSAPTDQVTNYISAFDMGFLLRRDHIVNRVACPMKWLEYWQCGVPLVTTQAVRIISETQGAALNCTIDMSDVIGAAKHITAYADRIKKERQWIKFELVRQVEEKWTWPTGLRAVQEVFDALESPDGRCNRVLWEGRRNNSANI